MVISVLSLFFDGTVSTPSPSYTNSYVVQLSYEACLDATMYEIILKVFDFVYYTTLNACIKTTSNTKYIRHGYHIVKE